MKNKMVKPTSPNSEANQLAPLIQCLVILESYFVSTLRYVLKIFLSFLTHVADLIRNDFEDVMILMKESCVTSLVILIKRTLAKKEREHYSNLVSNKSCGKKMSVVEVKEVMGKLLATNLCDEESEEVFEEEVSLQEVREAFEVFDENKDGFIDAEEVQRVLCSLGVMEASKVECKEMIKTFDNNGDGKIDFNEFTEIVEDSFR